MRDAKVPLIDRVKNFVSRLPLLRSIALKLLILISRDITIANPYTGDRLLVNMYRHKAYWYFGRSRERATMERFKSLISRGDTVVEIGGHIGFISQYFSLLVGNEGRVIVFEPGSNNLPYAEVNLRKDNVKLEKVVIADKIGEAVLYEDNITGQNNSLLPNYKNVASVSASHNTRLVKTKVPVQITTLDKYLQDNGITCHFIKIDIEGYELNALRGMKNTLKSCEHLMIEVTNNQADVSNILMSGGFSIEDATGVQLMPIPKTLS